MASRVIARLSGAERPATGPEDTGKPQEASGGKPDGTPTMPQMILEVLKMAEMDGATPKQVTDEIRRQWWPDVNGANVSAIMWRMWKRGDLMKDEGSSKYELPEEIEAADDAPLKDASATSLFD